MSDHELERIEDAVAAALAGLKAEGLVKTLEPFQDLMGVDDLRTLIAKFPALGIMAQDLDIRSGNRADEYRAGFLVVVCDRNSRGLKSAMRGDTRSPGVYALLKAVRGRLHGARLLTGWTRARCAHEGLLDVDLGEGAAVYGARYEIKTQQYREA